MNGILGGYKVQLLSYSEVYSDKIYSYFLIFEGIGGALSFLFVFKAIKGWTGANKLFIFLGLVMVLTHYFQNIYTIFMLSMFAGMTITIVGANIYTIILTKFDERLASATVSVTFALGLLAIPIGNWAVSYNTNTPDVFHYLGFMLLITGFYFITMKKEFEN
jgi:hypothetical protein